MAQTFQQTDLVDVKSLKPEGDVGSEQELSPSWDGPGRTASKTKAVANSPRMPSKRRGTRAASKLRSQFPDLPLRHGEFHSLLEKLVQAHVQEVEAARVVGSDVGTSSHPIGHSFSQETTNMEPTQLSPSMAALLNLRKGRGSEHSAGSVTADRILKAWDEEDLTSNEFSGNGGVVEPESPPSERTTMAGLLRKCFLSARFEVLMSCLVLTNTVWMAAQLQVEGGIYGAAWRGETDLSSLSTWRSIFMTGEQCFAAIFVLEVWLRVLVLRRAFFMVWLNYIDFFVGIACMAELIVVMRDGGTSSLDTLFLLRLLRVGKLARGLKLVGLTSNLSSLQLLVKCLVSSRAMLFWTFCLLALLQAVAGIILNMFAHQYFQEAMHDLSKREAVYLYFGTFTRSFLSMFEIMFANWGPPCRVLVEHISEWFAVFFLLYRCVFGFALLNVVNSVFVQQTMKTASSDEELAFKQKEKDRVVYNRKVKKLFQNIDISGDGAINLEEFTKLVQSPKLKFWMSQLELEYHDLLSLFEFLDNGDGEITLSEFIEGAARLRGNAKALDIWRMETKLEVLFDYTLEMLSETVALNVPPASPISEKCPDSPGGIEREKAKSVQDVLENSNYKHLRAATSMMNSRNFGSPPDSPTSESS